MMDFKSKLQQAKDEETRRQQAEAQQTENERKATQAQEWLDYYERMKPYAIELMPIFQSLDLEAKLTEIRDECWGAGEISRHEISPNQPPFRGAIEREIYLGLVKAEKMPQYLLGYSLELSYPYLRRGYYPSAIDAAWVEAEIQTRTVFIGVYMGVLDLTTEILEPIVVVESERYHDVNKRKISDGGIAPFVEQMLTQDCLKRGGLEKELPIYPPDVETQRELIIDFQANPGKYSEGYDDRLLSNYGIERPWWKRIFGG